jgi:hypothetical protein
LAIAAHVARAHDGKLILANRIPCGLRATITLAVNAAPWPGIAASAPEQGRP